jgi:uridylate kinase
VYDCDPAGNPAARKYDTLTYAQAIRDNLAIMDQAAFALCRENRLRLVVCRLLEPGNLVKVLTGKRVGTLIQQ